MSEAEQRRATVLHFRRGTVAPARKFVPLAKTLELYSSSYPKRDHMLMLVESWLFAAQQHGVLERSPEYIAALSRAITALRLSTTVPEAIALLRRQESSAFRALVP